MREGVRAFGRVEDFVAEYQKTNVFSIPIYYDSGQKGIQKKIS